MRTRGSIRRVVCAEDRGVPARGRGAPGRYYTSSSGLSRACAEKVLIARAHGGSSGYSARACDDARRAGSTRKLSEARSAFRLRRAVVSQGSVGARRGTLRIEADVPAFLRRISPKSRSSPKKRRFKRFCRRSKGEAPSGGGFFAAEASGFCDGRCRRRRSTRRLRHRFVCERVAPFACGRLWDSTSAGGSSRLPALSVRTAASGLPTALRASRPRPWSPPPCRTRRSQEPNIR